MLRKLTISETLRLRETEVSPNKTNEAGTSPEETSLSSPVESGRVHEEGLNNTNDNAHNVVDIAGQDHGFNSETSGWNFGDQRVANRSDRYVVGKR